MMTELERNNLAKQFLPLVKKISNQMYDKCSLDYEEIEGFAWEGFVKAMNSYDKTRSNMSFASYAAYGIRHAIQDGISDTSSTIAVSYYMRKKMSERGEDAPTAISIEKNYENEDHLAQLGFEDETLFDNPWQVLIQKLSENFPRDWVDMFCDEYGLNGHPVVKCKEIAERLGVSGCLITKRTKKMHEFISSNDELRELLRELL